MTDPDDMLTEYRFDHSKARPNRFAAQIEKNQSIKGKKMSVTTINISKETAQHLASLSMSEARDADEKLRTLLEAEYRRRIARYSLTDRQLSQKYNMDFATFEKQQMTKKKGYSWEVESDAIAWERAVDGIATMQKQLQELRRLKGSK
ncbi:MAG: hypothetical protein ACE5I1_29005 [bacterium]